MIISRFRRYSECEHDDSSSCRGCREGARTGTSPSADEIKAVQAAARLSDFDLARNLAGMNPSFTVGGVVRLQEAAMLQEAAFRLCPHLSASYSD